MTSLSKQCDNTDIHFFLWCPNWRRNDGGFVFFIAEECHLPSSTKSSSTTPFRDESNFFINPNDMTNRSTSFKPWDLQMRSRVSLRRCVRPSLRPSAPSHKSWISENCALSLKLNKKEHESQVKYASRSLERILCLYSVRLVLFTSGLASFGDRSSLPSSSSPIF